jgi:hypothetical protein
MKVIVLTDRKVLQKSFKPGKDCDVAFLGTSETKKIGAVPALVYLDLASFERTKWNAAVKKLLSRDELRVGLIDPAGFVTDPAVEFHRGIVDFIPKGALTAGIGTKRFVQAEAFRPLPVPASRLADDVPLSGSDWSGVEENKEYLFGFLFIEFDHINQLKTDLGQAGAAEYSRDFFNYVSEYFAVWDGYLWIRNDFGALYLFPFDGKKLHILESALELNLNADILKFTRFRQKAAFRQAIHIGKTIYRKRGNTGDVVSDTINSLFHLGSRWTPKGSLVITEEVFPFVPPGLRAYFKEKGEYEGRKIWQLKDRN